MVSKRTQELVQIDKEHVVHAWTIVGENSGVVFERTHGVYLVDTEGKEYIDFSSGHACCNLGHGRKEIINAITEAVNKTDFSSNFWGYSNPYIIKCAQKLASITPANLSRFHFTSGGSESVDTAIKTARLYWYHKSQSQRSKIISLFDSNHGVSGFSLWASNLGRGSLQTGQGSGMPGFSQIPSYYCYRCSFGLTYPECDVRCARFLEETIQIESPNSIAAFIAEGMIGGGGFIEPPPEWWPIVSEICRKYDVLLIADEVLSGFTRTGKMFCIDHWNIKPDIMTMAKGISGAYLPFGVMAISDEVFNVLKGNMFMHGYTYSGHAIPAAAACAALDIYIKEKVVENVVKVGNHVKQRLDAEFMSLPCVGNISGMGLNYSIELVTNKKTKNPISLDTKTEIIRKIRENGVFTRAIGRFGNRLHIGPPCTSTIEEVDKALDIVLSVVAEVKP